MNMYVDMLCVVLLASSLFALNVQDVIASCSDDQWTCDDGACISVDDKCDETLNCEDGSDEAYCDATPSQICVLPEHPANGRYFPDKPKAKPGDEYEFISIKINCRKGFVLDGPKTVSCVNGVWQHQVPQCVAQCHLPSHPSVEYRCLVFGSLDVPKECDEYVPTGTEISPQCRRPVYYSTKPLPYMRCIDGHWDYIAKCDPDCGTATPAGTELSIGGKPVRRAEIPWHAGIYVKTTMPVQQICGGSLISTDVVISAAHCFWSNIEDRRQPETDFAVAVGKVYRAWDSYEETEQKSDVKALHLPDYFRGSETNFQADIAVVVVTIPFQFNKFIRPLCVDFGHIFQERQLQPGNTGKVAGWGLTSETGMEAQVLQVIDLPFVNITTCLANSETFFRAYITSDKFCAGFINANKALCPGDSGGGLAFSESDKGTDRYYLRGIVSTAASDFDKLCNANTYTSFTQLLIYEHFIKKFWRAEYTSLNLTQSNGNNADGSKQKEICILPDYPTHGTYTTNIPNAKPGDAYDTVTINVQCREGYSTASSGNIHCDQGWWSEDIPKCIKQCLLVINPMVEHRCFSAAFNEFRPCKKYEDSGALVSPRCIFPDYKSNVLEFMKCTEGRWNYAAECVPDYIPEMRIEINKDSDNKTHCTAVCSPDQQHIVSTEDFLISVQSDTAVCSPDQQHIVSTEDFLISVQSDTAVCSPDQQHIVSTEDFLISVQSDEELKSGECFSQEDNIDLYGYLPFSFGSTLRVGEGYIIPFRRYWYFDPPQKYPDQWTCRFKRSSSNKTLKCNISFYAIVDPELGYLAINDKKVSTKISSDKYSPLHSYGNYSFTDGELVKISCHKTRKNPDDAILLYKFSEERGNEALSYLPEENSPLEYYLRMSAGNEGSQAICNFTSQEWDNVYHITRVYFNINKQQSKVKET